MTNHKISLAIVDDSDLDTTYVCKAINETAMFQITLTAENGRELINKLSSIKKKPVAILMDMQMPKCDGLLCTIICKILFPSIKIIGISNHSAPIIVSEFIKEGGDGFLRKIMLVKDSYLFPLYNDDKIFENSLLQIILENKIYIDPQLNFNQELINNIFSVDEIVTNKYSFLKHHEVLYILLTAAGFSIEEKAKLLNISQPSVKKYGYKLFSLFNVINSQDLTIFAISVGLVKIVNLNHKFIK